MDISRHARMASASGVPVQRLISKDMFSQPVLLSCVLTILFHLSSAPRKSLQAAGYTQSPKSNGHRSRLKGSSRFQSASGICA